MSSSNHLPAEPLERVTISSRSHSIQPTPTTPAPHPGETVFGDDEETESFYVILDISGDDFAAYGKYRDGRKFRPRLGDRYYDEDEEQQAAEDGEEPEQEEEDEDTDPDEKDTRSDGEGGAEEEDGSQPDDNSDASSSSSSSSSDSTSSRKRRRRPRELTLQILDLDTHNPLVNYEGKIYTCKWGISNGTEMVFEPPPTIPPIHSQLNPDGTASLEERVEEDLQPTTANGRKLRQNPEARLVCTTIHRLEGWPGKLRPRGRDKQEVSTKARMFAERLDAVLEHKIKEMARSGQDVSGITMKKFSEGQQTPGVGKEVG
ncbi:hypothetical protein ABW20_dc0105563 [Dactylellina cionopaga]|nr:hypothetical protein ABW20_dc0105563 [Dactylellina cionopaga]